LRLFRTNPDAVSHDEWSDRMMPLLEERHLGVTNSVMSLVTGLAQNSSKYYQFCCGPVIHLLGRLAIQSACQSEYIYHDVPCHWLQVKCLRFLQLYPPPSETALATKLSDVLKKILTNTEVSEKVNKSNADHSILFEAVNLIIIYGAEGSEPSLRSKAMNLLGRFISVREPNIRYLGLDAMSRLARLEGSQAIRKHQSTVLISLKDADLSMRRRALDLLFVMCDTTNAIEIVGELVSHLVTSDMAIRDEFVLKIAILAEKYAANLDWYVDTILQLITIAGDHVSDDIWHRLVQIVTNNKDLQEYAAEQMFRALQPKVVHETCVNVGGYILGEFGFLIAEKGGMSGEEQFAVLHKHFAASSETTRALLLSAYAKLANLYQECRDLTEEVFRKLTTSGDLELQQRACEYLGLPETGEEIMEDVLREMPAFPEDRESALELRLKKQEASQKEDPFATNAGEEGDDDDDDSVGPSDSNDSGSVRSREFSRSQDSSGSYSGSEPDYQGGALEETEDLVSFDEDVSGGASEQGIDSAILPRLKVWFNGLLMAQQGMLFENEILQVGVRHEYRGAQGRMALYFKNKSTTPLSNFQAAIKNVPYLKTQVQNAPTEIQIGDQATQMVLVECIQPFDEVPEIKLSFIAGSTSFGYPLRLPLVVSSFFEPVSLGKDDFIARWQKLDGQEREAQEIFKSNSGINAEKMASVKKILCEAMKMALVQDPAGNDAIILAAATFRTGTVGPDGNKLSVGCLLKLDVNPAESAFRVTVRAVHGKVSVGLKNTARILLA